MSAAEIADNRWELTASKPPVATISGLAQMVVMGGFALFFGWIIAFSVVGIVSPKKDTGLAEQYKNLKADGRAKPAAE